MRVEDLRSYWWVLVTVVTIIGGLVAFGSDIESIMKAPEQIAETSKAVQETTQTMTTYIQTQQQLDLRQDALYAQQNRLLEIMAENLMEISKEDEEFDEG